MNNLRISFLELVVALVGAAASECAIPGNDQNPGVMAHTAQVQTETGGALDVSLFYEELSPYGTWVQIPEWGWSWRPDETSPGWRPYANGRWILTRELGWFWIDDAPWGWATSHYGRWGWSDYGWVWVPDTQWAPAWVTWRSGPGIIGWSALPPGVAVGAAEDRGDNEPPYYDYWARSSGWVFCEDRRFAEQDVHNHLIPTARNELMIRNTQPTGRVHLTNGRMINDAIAPKRVELAIGAAVPAARVREKQSISPRIETHIDSRLHIGEVTVVHPKIGNRTFPKSPRTALPNEVRETGRDAAVAPDQVLQSLLERQQREMDALSEFQRREAEELAALHSEQVPNPSAQLQSQLEDQQQLERQALADQHAQQRAALERWHKLERELVDQSLAQPVPTGG